MPCIATAKRVVDPAPTSARGARPIFIPPVITKSTADQKSTTSPILPKWYMTLFFCNDMTFQQPNFDRGDFMLRCLVLCLSILSSSVLAGEPNWQIKEELTNAVGMTLRLVPAGKFVMGAPDKESRRRVDEPQRDVTLTRSFMISQTEVTQSQWFAVMKTKPWAGKTWVRSNPNCAAAYISWNDAQEFCVALSRIESSSYRLPTEAEWEYSCRANSVTPFCFGVDEKKLPEFAFIGVNSFDISERYSHPVAQKKANAFGLYDMHGNNWEWCSDRYAVPTAKASVDPVGPSVGSRRVIKGGSWHGAATLCRSACRFKHAPEMKTNDIGFRVVMELPSEPNRVR